MTGLDVEAARKVLLDSLPADPKWVPWVDGVVERLTECVTPQGIDRDALIEAYQQTWEDYQRADRPRLFRDALADRILALVRPVEGVTLTPGEAADLAFVARIGEPHVLDTKRAERLLALAARLEAAQ